MLAPPTKDIFLGLRQQVCSLLSQLYGWFLHTCNLTAWWKTQDTKYHITWKSALLWPNLLLGLFCQNPLQVTVFCCLKRMTGAQRMRPLPKHFVFVPGCLGEKGCSPFPKLERILASSDLPWSMNRFCWKKLHWNPKDRGLKIFPWSNFGTLLLARLKSPHRCPACSSCLRESSPTAQCLQPTSWQLCKCDF